MKVYISIYCLPKSLSSHDLKIRMQMNHYSLVFIHVYLQWVSCALKIVLHCEEKCILGSFKYKKKTTQNAVVHKFVSNPKFFAYSAIYKHYFETLQGYTLLFS